MANATARKPTPVEKKLVGVADTVIAGAWEALAGYRLTRRLPGGFLPTATVA